MEFEGEALMGRWLPRALADLAVLMAAQCGTQIKRSDVLMDWGLPHLSRIDACAADRHDEVGRADRLAALAAEIEEL